MIGRLLAFALALALAGTAAAAPDVVLDGPLVQGGLVQGRVSPGAQVSLDGRALRVSPGGCFVFGFGRDAPPKAVLEVVAPDGERLRRVLSVGRREYRIERIDGLPEKMVTPPPEQLERIKRENAEIAAARARDTDAEWFAAGFTWPVIGPITGVYGSQRVLNGKPRRPHFGVDVAPGAGVPVRAPAPGIVALAEPDLYYSGGTVIIDHGHGVSSLMMHMASVDVVVGQRVRRGDRIGTVGATGRASGPHLDWRLNWFEVRLDPQLVAGPMPDPKK